ncbi:hypothetical protein [Adhaeribacter arboris]|nr:hypothetical protein [Adhaeribacter arboris]
MTLEKFCCDFNGSRAVINYNVNANAGVVTLSGNAYQIWLDVRYSF